MKNINYKSNKVSVIIPTYNYAHFIKGCIESVLSQSYENIEIIVIDDGSTDHTKLVLKPLLEKIKYIYKDNNGLSSARNTGIDNSTGEYLQFLDSDDLLHPKAIEHRVNFLKFKPERKIAVCRNRRFTKTKPNGEPISRRGWYLHNHSLNTHLYYSNIAPPHSFLIHRDVVSDVGYFDTSLKACEDYDYWLRALFKGYSHYYCKKGLVYYRIHDDSMSHKRLNQYYHDAIMVQRLNKYIEQSSQYNVEDHLGANVAFMCGLIKTLLRLSKAHSQLQNCLEQIIKPSDKTIQNLNNKFNTINRELESMVETSHTRTLESIHKNIDIKKFTILFYFYRLANIVRLYEEDSETECDNIKFYFEDLLKKLKHSSGIDINASSINSATFTGKLSVLESIILYIEYLNRYKWGIKFTDLILRPNAIDQGYSIKYL